MDFPDGGLAAAREAYQSTLEAQLIDLMRDFGEPVSVDDCVDALSESFSGFTTPTGKPIRRSPSRAISATLSSLSGTVFFDVSGDQSVWALNPTGAINYEAKCLEDRINAAKQVSPKALKRRRKVLAADDDGGGGGGDGGGGAGADIATATGAGAVPDVMTRVQHLRSLSAQLRPSPEFFHDPFAGLPTTADAASVSATLGRDRFVAAMQTFNYVDQLLVLKSRDSTPTMANLHATLSDLESLLGARPAHRPPAPA